MDTKTMIREVKNAAEKHKNDRKFTGQTVITDIWQNTKPPRKVSEAQREAAGERFRKMWEEKREMEEDQ